MNNKQKKKAAIEKAAKNMDYEFKLNRTAFCPVTCSLETYPCSTSLSPPGWTSFTPAEQEEKDNTMYVEDSPEKAHLTSRLHNAMEDKTIEARKTFGLSDDDSPITAKEIVERITAGKFTLPKEGADKYDWFGSSPYQRIRWRDPAKLEDKVGYEAFMEKLYEAYTKADDEITIYDPADGLKALREFENFTIQ